jgi:serine/threonine-protein kinase
LLALAAFAVRPKQDRASPGGGLSQETVLARSPAGKAATEPKPGDRSPARRGWVVQDDGYQLTDGDRDESSDGPKSLIRKSDHVAFQRVVLMPGAPVYLPEGYEPGDPNDLVGGRWPRVLIRAGDKHADPKHRARFIRIPGKTYLRGDPRQHDRSRESNRSPLAHWVEVPGFYLQDTEVTNAEIEDYLRDHPEDEPNWTMWRELYTGMMKKQDADARLRAAVGVSYGNARAYSRGVRGRLPTEAEWELAAKSGIDDRLWVWGIDSRARGGRLLARLFDPSKRIESSPGRQFPDDKTVAGIHDMTGNVREWCLDPYEPYAQLVPAANTRKQPLKDEPRRADVRAHRSYVVRGGSFVVEDRDEATTFYRDQLDSTSPDPTVGFRVVIECPDDRVVAMPAASGRSE